MEDVHSILGVEAASVVVCCNALSPNQDARSQICSSVHRKSLVHQVGHSAAAAAGMPVLLVVHSHVHQHPSLQVYHSIQLWQSTRAHQKAVP